jgi:hypothetical protein
LVETAAKRAFAVVLLLLPAWINGGPLIFADSRAYYRGGHAVIEKLVGILTAASPGTGADLNSRLAAARGVRSAFYSLFVYGLAQIGSLWLIVVAQAVFTIWCITLLQRTFGIEQTRFLITITLMALFTTLPWTVSVIMPDIFTPLMGVILICMLFAWQQLSNALRYTLLGLFGACIVMHITNLPLAVGLILLSMALNWRRFGTMWRRWSLAGGMIGCAVLAMLMVGVVGFGEWTITPQSPPFLLARSINDGPGRLYLQEHCPEAHLAMCQHLDKLNISVDDFMWHANGVYSAVPAEERVELRRENKVFILAAEEHPWMEAKAMLRHAIAQLMDFTLLDAAIHSGAHIEHADFIEHPFEPWRPLRWSFTVIDYIGMILSLGVLGWLWATCRLNVPTKQLVIMILGLVMINAAVTGAFSDVAPRYNARTSWLLPLLAILLYGMKPWTPRPVRSG